MKNQLIILFLAEIAFFLLFWLASSQAGFILCAAVSSVAAGVFLVSFITDKIEASRISKTYFYAMIITIIAPLLVLLLLSYS